MTSLPKRFASLVLIVWMAGACQSGLPAKGSTVAPPGEPLVLGVAASLSGPLAEESQGIVNAVNLALEPYRQVRGHDIVVQTADDSCDAAQTEVAINQLLANTRLVGVIGPSCSAGCVAAESPLDRRALVMISPRCTDIAVTRQGYEGALRTAWTDAFDAVAAARYTNDHLHISSVFFVHDGSIYARGIRDIFKLFYGKDNLAGVEEIASGSEDFGPAVRAIRKSTAGMVYYAGFADDAVRFIAQLRAAGITLPVMMPDAARGDDNLLSTVPNPGMIYVTEVTRSPGSGYQAFAAAYRSRYGADPGPYAAEAYDAATALLRAVARTAEQDGSQLVLDRRALRDAVHRSDFKGALGRVRFRLNGDLFEDGTVRMFAFKDGHFELQTTLDLYQ